MDLGGITRFLLDNLAVVVYKKYNWIILVGVPKMIAYPQSWSRFLPVFLTFLFVHVLCVSSSIAWAAQTNRPNIPTGSFGCTMSVKKFEKWSNGFEHAAVAIAKAKTITGSRGCGRAWNKKSKRSAERTAIANCKKHAFHPETCAVAKSN
ncbi:MAG: hypothetical protein GY746_08835 [Gammaproteobacteria bacterium]|nr:hypothetical protein [Gammaproteobacteria bacterium]